MEKLKALFSWSQVTIFISFFQLAFNTFQHACKYGAILLEFWENEQPIQYAGSSLTAG
jgi:hypothetical protein